MKKYLALFFGLFLLVSCENPNTEQDINPDLAFTIDIPKLTARSVVSMVTPNDVGQTFVGVIIEKIQYDKFMEGGDFAQAVLTAYAAQGLKPVDIMLAGPTEMATQYLTPETEYVIGVFGVDMDGVIASKPTFKFFTTPWISDELVDCTFDVKITDIKADAAKITVVPSNKNVMYGVFPGEKAVLTAIGGDKLALAWYTVTYLESQGDVDFSNIDSSMNLMKGDGMLDCSTLLGGSDQIVVCFVVNDYGEVLSSETQISLSEFKTPMPEASTCTFDLNIEYLTFNSAVASVRPSSGYEYYYYDTVVKSWLEQNYPESTDPDHKKFMEYIINDGIHSRGTGSLMKTGDYGTLAPSTDYYVFAFATSAGRPTSKLFLKQFTTPEFVYKSGGNAKVGQKIASIQDGAIFGAGYAGFGIISMTYTPNIDTKEYFIAVPPENEIDKWNAFSEDDLKKAIILSGGSTNHPNNTGGWFWALYTDAVFYAVGQDSEGRFGEVSKLVAPIVLGAPQMSSVMSK